MERRVGGGLLAMPCASHGGDPGANRDVIKKKEAADRKKKNKNGSACIQDPL